MKRRWLAWLWMLVLAGCAFESPPVVQQPTPHPTVTLAAPTTRAMPSATPVSPTPTSGLTATPSSPAPTAGLGTTSTAAPQPPAPLPATASPATFSPAHADQTYCRRSFGPQSTARFSARLESVVTRAAARHTEVILSFSDINGTLHGTAACTWAAAWPQASDLGSLDAPGSVFIGLQLDDWAHDEAFATSVLTATLAITADKALTPARATPVSSDGTRDRGEDLQLALAANSLDSRGVLIGIGLSEPRPFAVRVEDERLIVEIAQSDAAPFPPPDDPLGEEQGAVQALDQPVFFVQDGTMYRSDAAGAQPISATLESITDLAVAPGGALLAACAAASPAAETRQRNRTGVLWLVETDGSNERLLADVGGCADPAFDPTGQRVAFAAPADAALPAQQIWTVPVGGGPAEPVSAALDQWSRSSPRWLDGTRLVYRAMGENGTSVLMLNQGGTERELSARLLTGSAYRGIGAFVVDPEAQRIAVQALHADDDGADLVVLQADGALVATEQRGFWQQPLGFSSDGLLYITTECPSATVQRYALRRRTERGTIETLLTGSTANTIGAALVQGDALVYARSAAAQGSTPAANGAASQAASELWLLTDNGAARRLLHRAPASITRVAGATSVPE